MESVNFKKPLLIIGLTIVLVGLWNWPTLLSVSKPAFQGTFLTRGNQVNTADPYNANEAAFHYPRLAIDAPLTVSPDTSPLQSKDWGSIREALTKGVSLNFSGENFENVRLAYLTGHSSDTYPHPYSAVFAALGQAKEGDEFIITGSGRIDHYQVVGTHIIAPQKVEDFSENSLLGSAEGHYVALVTCWPIFTTSKRLVVVGKRLGEPGQISYSGR